MWFIDDKLFINTGIKNNKSQEYFSSNIVYDYIEGSLESLESLKKSIARKNLSLVIGNGMSLLGIYEIKQNIFCKSKIKDSDSHEIGWNEVIEKKWKELFKDASNVSLNSLSKAEIIVNEIMRHPDKDENDAKKELLEQLEKSCSVFNSGSEILAKLLCNLGPNHVITTNYDNNIESSLRNSEMKFEKIVYSAVDRKLKPDCHTSSENSAEIDLKLHKVHGSFYDESDKNNKNIIKNYDSIVISESDYDSRLSALANEELHLNKNSSLKEAIQAKDMIIFGKGVIWEDLSFMHILRKREKFINNERCSDDYKTYWILNSFNLSDAYLMRSLKIHPIYLNLPINPDNSHYYFANFHLIDELSSELIVDNIKNTNNEFKKHYKKSKKRATFLAYGLSSMNSVGRVENGKNTISDNKKIVNRLIKPGRNNVGFEIIEDYPGGSCLTAATTYSLLNGALSEEKDELSATLISACGDDDYGREIIRHCRTYNIDADYISKQKNAKTHHSTVIVHDVDTVGSNNADLKIFYGQRVFLDRKMKNILMSDRVDEITNYLKSEKCSIRVAYVDKWLFDEDVFQNKSTNKTHIEYLKKFLGSKKTISLYETGSKGSKEYITEESLRDEIDILTATYHFLNKKWKIDEREICKKYNANLSKCYGKNVENIDYQFTSELDGISKLIKHVCTDDGWSNKNTSSIFCDSHPFDQYLGKENGLKWMVVTVHDKGAVAFRENDKNIFALHIKPRTDDIINMIRKFYVGYAAAIKFNNSNTKSENRYINILKNYLEPGGEKQAPLNNTAGAGDTLRGAMSYALDYTINRFGSVDEFRSAEKKYPIICQSIVQFSVDIASLKCYFQNMKDTDKPLGKKNMFPVLGFWDLLIYMSDSRISNSSLLQKKIANNEDIENAYKNLTGFVESCHSKLRKEIEAIVKLS